ncbi:hypothetical protein OFO93_37045, partial [Escherichia coli]|nr:hypothetical protein [Escherichia coli]
GQHLRHFWNICSAFELLLQRASISKPGDFDMIYEAPTEILHTQAEISSSGKASKFKAKEFDRDIGEFRSG